MLAKPSITELIEKTGASRYVTTLAIAKRARQIATKRIEEDDSNIEDAVQVATMEVENNETILEEKNKDEVK